MIELLLLMFAFLCFLIAAWQSPPPSFNRIVCIGLAALALAFLLAHTGIGK